jgi:hypothetical protein
VTALRCMPPPQPSPASGGGGTCYCVGQRTPSPARRGRVGVGVSGLAASMIAYAIRRILLMIPTLFAIMVVNFVIVQAAPGGPVQQMIAKLKGNMVSATERVSGGANETAPVQSSGDSFYRGARGIDPALIQQLVHQYGFDKPPLERFELMMKNYAGVRFRRQLLPGPQRRQPDPRQTAGVDLDRAVDDATYLSHVDPARHPEGGQGRQRLRRLDQLGDHRRLRGAELSVRGAADRAVRRRQLPVDLPAARPGQRRLGELSPGRCGSPIISGTSRCRSPRW